MTRIEEARDFLTQIGVPNKQRSDMCCYVLVALSNMAKKAAWSEAENPWMGPHDIIVYLDTNGIKSYAENSRETIRKIACARSEIWQSLRTTALHPTAANTSIV